MDVSGNNPSEQGNHGPERQTSCDSGEPSTLWVVPPLDGGPGLYKEGWVSRPESKPVRNVLPRSLLLFLSPTSCLVSLKIS